MANTEAARPEIKGDRQGVLGKLSWVWLVPFAAITGALFMTWQSYNDRDVPITIVFPSAEGLEVGKTLVKYQDVTVGTVTDLSFADDLKTVFVETSMHKDMVKYVDADTNFWLVTAQISAQGVTGLETILDGAYINADWDAEQGEQLDVYTALDRAPIIRTGQKGIEIILATPESGSVSVGAPILHKGVNMGTVKAVDYEISTDSVLITGFIEEPYDKIINTGTRFWNVSGINIELGEAGLDLNVGSLSSILQGGVEFSTTISGGVPIQQRDKFDLYKNKRDAEDSLLDDNLRSTINLSSPFEGTVKGLEVGSDVFYFGLKVGQVQTLSAISELDENGAPEVRMLASYTLQPNRLGVSEDYEPEENIAFIAELVEKKNLRARLMPNSIFSGGVHIELFEAPDEDVALLDRSAEPFPILPSVPTPANTLEVAAGNVLDRVAALPVEELMTQVINLIADIDTIVSDKNTKKIPEEISVLLSNVNSFAGSDSLQGLPDELEEALSSVNAILREFEDNKAVANVVSALENVKVATARVSQASEKLPGLINGINTFVKGANTWPAEQVVASADQLLHTANTILDSEGTKKVPDALAGALSEAQLALKELREGGAAENLSNTLQSASKAADGVAAATERLPELASRLERLANTADSTIGSFGPRSEVNRELRAAIDDIREAVKSINALAQAIRRKPNSLLVGR